MDKQPKYYLEYTQFKETNLVQLLHKLISLLVRFDIAQIFHFGKIKYPQESLENPWTDI